MIFENEARVPREFRLRDKVGYGKLGRFAPRNDGGTCVMAINQRFLKEALIKS